LLRSDFQAPHVAPEGGYVKSVEAYRIAAPKEPLKDSTASSFEYMFRLRTEKDEEGSILKAHVGWVDGGINMTQNDNTNVTNEANRLRISFAYYWNPDPLSRSLEPKEVADRQGR
jgi:hypothetical protein